MGPCQAKTQKRQPQPSALKLIKIEQVESTDTALQIVQVNSIIMNLWLHANELLGQAIGDQQLIKLRNSVDGMVQNSIKRIGRRSKTPEQDILRDIIFANILFQQMEKIASSLEEALQNKQFVEQNQEIIISIESLIDGIQEFGNKYKNRVQNQSTTNANTNQAYV